MRGTSSRFQAEGAPTRRSTALSGDWASLFGIIAAVGVLASQPMLVGLGSVVLLAWGIAWGWDRLALTRVSFRRSLSRNQAFPGETVELRLQVSNHKTLPLPWVQVSDWAPVGGERDAAGGARAMQEERAILAYSTSLSWYEQVGWTVQLRCSQRGLYRFGPATIASGDIFGFFHSETTDLSTDQLLIYPRVVPLADLGVPAGKPFGEVRGGSQIFEDPTRVAGLRDYRQEDPWRKVDWKATARLGRLQVRVFEPTVTPTLLVLLNGTTTEGEARWGYNTDLLERAVTVAASVAHRAFTDRYSVGLLTNAHSLISEAAIQIPPSRDPHHLNTLLEALATVAPMISASLEEMLWQQVQRLPLGATLTLVTAILPESLLDTVLDLRRRGHHLTLLWVGERPLAESLEGGIRVYDVGGQVARLLAEAEERDGVA